jgi:alginate O-acetyltransferase complex protein AlgI
MNLTHILIFSAAILLYRFLLRAWKREWLLLIASIIAIFWLQPALPIRGLDFWLPLATLALAVFAWVITAPADHRWFKEDIITLVLVFAVVLALGLTRYLSVTGILTPSRPPQTLPLIIALVGSALLLWLFSLPRRSLPLLAGIGILFLLVIFVALKLPPLTAWLGTQLRLLTGQSAGMASALDIRWLGFSYVAFRLIHTFRDRQSGRLAAYTLREYLTYIIFFPAITAGPIDRIERFVRDLRQPAGMDADQFAEGGRRLLLGLFKKFVLADSLALIALNASSAGQVRAGGWLWLMLYAFAFQLYLDFSGYTDIAIGMARWLGIQLPENFKRPYLMPNLTQFWNNWHMTLTQWFRAYYFNPLTRALRSAQKPLPAWIVLLFTQLTTMLLIGLWHGISWNFVLWGAWHGLGMFVQNRWSEWIKPRVAALESHPRLKLALTCVNVFLTFNFVALGWLWFALPTPALALQALGRLFGA